MYKQQLTATTLAFVLLGFTSAICNGQATRHCANGVCGSPLAGPCIPARMTYCYVPTTWRRWPTDTPSHDARGAESLPTPAAEPEEMPAPDMLAPGSSTPSRQDESPRSSDEMRVPPAFDNSPLTPEFGDEPSATPFGDEPQPPPSTADPLAEPFSDEPPTPPADDFPSSLDSPPSLPSESLPSASESAPALDREAPPAMPDDDPFKDDPDQNSIPLPKSGADLRQKYRALQAQMDRAELNRRSNTAGTDDVRRDSTVASEPRLLRADGQSLTPGRLPETQSTDPNPLRFASQPVQRTAFSQDTSSVDTRPTADSRPAESRASTWRRNPLRAN